MLYGDLVAASQRTAATSKRSEKVATLTDLLRAMPPNEITAAIGLLIGVYLLFLAAIGVFVPDQITLPWWGPVGGIDTALSWGAIPLVLVLSVFLMVPVASAFSGFFLDDVAEAVEARHYPQVTPPPRVPLLTALVDSVNFFGVIVLANALALVLYLFAGPFIPLLFWAVNGYLLGREYFTLAAMRHISAVETLRWHTVTARRF